MTTESVVLAPIVTTDSVTVPTKAETTVLPAEQTVVQDVTIDTNPDPFESVLPPDDENEVVV